MFQKTLWLLVLGVFWLGGGCGGRPIHEPIYVCHPDQEDDCPQGKECRLIGAIYQCVDVFDASLPECEEGQRRCSEMGNAIEMCQEGQWTFWKVCGGDTGFCVDGECLMCPPGEDFCRGDEVWNCAEEGDNKFFVRSCDVDLGEKCLDGLCEIEGR